MSLSIKLFGTMRNLLGSRELVLDFSGTTLGDVVEYLSAKYGNRVKAELLDERGSEDFSYVVFASGRRLNSLSDEVHDGDEMVIADLISGG